MFTFYLCFPPTTDRLDDIVPTYGFSRADLRVSGYDLSLYDLGGDDSIRDIWRKYYAEVTLLHKEDATKRLSFHFFRLVLPTFSLNVPIGQSLATG